MAAGVRCTARQFFEVGFFHADPHPGNLLVDGRGRLAYLDFGRMGRLDDDDRFALMSVVVNFANREPRRPVTTLRAAWGGIAATPRLRRG